MLTRMNLTASAGCFALMVCSVLAPMFGHGSPHDSMHHAQVAASYAGRAFTVIGLILGGFSLLIVLAMQLSPRRMMFGFLAASVTIFLVGIASWQPNIGVVETTAVILPVDIVLATVLTWPPRHYRINGQHWRCWFGILSTIPLAALCTTMLMDKGPFMAWSAAICFVTAVITFTIAKWAVIANLAPLPAWVEDPFEDLPAPR